MVSQAIQHIEGLLRARKLDGTLAKLEKQGVTLHRDPRELLKVVADKFMAGA